MQPEQLEPLAGAGLDERRYQKLVHELTLAGAAFAHLGHKLPHVFVAPGAAQGQAALAQLLHHPLEMLPFFGHQGGQLVHQALLFGVMHDERNARTGRLLFAVGVVNQDFRQVFAGQVGPTRVGVELKFENCLDHGLARIFTDFTDFVDVPLRGC